MGLFTKVEDRPTPKEVYNWRIYACSCIASLAAAAIGYDSSFIGTSLALPSFVKEFNFASYTPQALAKEKETIISVYAGAAFFGAWSFYVVSHFLGRKLSLYFYMVFFLIGAGMNCGATGDKGLGLILGGRVLTGFAVGGCSSMVPIYISELSPPAIRGRLVGIWELGWQIGGMVGFWINYGVNRTLPPNRTQWLIPFAIQLVPVGLLFFLAFFIPESPRWLFTKGRREQGVKTLCWLRNLSPNDLYIVEEIGSIDMDMERYRNEVGIGIWKPFNALKHRSIQWRFLLGFLLFMWQNSAGINAINYYSPTVLQSMGVRGTSTTLLATGVFGVVKTIMTFVSLVFLVDKFGRRNLMMIGSCGASICMWIIGSYIKIAQPAKHPSDELTPGGTAAIFFFFLWTVPYHMAWAGNPWVIGSEMFDLDTRSLGQASSASSNWFWNFMITRFTGQMFLAVDYGVYYLFASMMLLAVVFVFFLVPETSHVPLEAMDRLFAIRPVREANKTIMEELRREELEFRQNTDGLDMKEGVAVEERVERTGQTA
ncbi:general substrate transporter [Coniochaeta ligniaria NRRL 30616]|uniref:Quinate transporter n=1 Tax=Coniochaeta ligniaria NRRL 30616 TaxID=1408157 RepID=A0A1J7IYZ6_9PEZI|nr:general substrate transporter [Coniochaeta ligniaria NRRL 30616]